MRSQKEEEKRHVYVAASEAQRLNTAPGREKKKQRIEKQSQRERQTPTEKLTLEANEVEEDDGKGLKPQSAVVAVGAEAYSDKKSHERRGLS